MQSSQRPSGLTQCHHHELVVVLAVCEEQIRAIVVRCRIIDSGLQWLHFEHFVTPLLVTLGASDGRGGPDRRGSRSSGRGGGARDPGQAGGEVDTAVVGRIVGDESVAGRGGGKGEQFMLGWSWALNMGSEGMAKT